MNTFPVGELMEEAAPLPSNIQFGEEITPLAKPVVGKAYFDTTKKLFQIRPWYVITALLASKSSKFTTKVGAAVGLVGL